MARAHAAALWILLLLVRPAAAAEKVSNWQVYKASDGLRESYSLNVTVSPRGNVWVAHREGDAFSWFDGYRIKTIPSPGAGNTRIYESRAGQLWSVSPEGLQEFRAPNSGSLPLSQGAWVSHPIPQIAQEFQNEPLRTARSISLLPIEQNRVLFLLSDQLLEFNAGEVRVLRRASETGLQKFSSMIAALDGGIWVAGQRGVAKIHGPLRAIQPIVPWTEYLLATNSPVQDLQRPLEDESGGLTVTADLAGESKRVLVHLKNGQWTVHDIPEENIRQAWRGDDDSFWVSTLKNLFVWRDNEKENVDEVLAAQFLDVATETNGVFWVATSEGLYRYAPRLWRTPAPMERMTLPVHSTVPDIRGRLWFATARSLIRFANGDWRTFQMPENIQRSFQPTESLMVLTNGSLLMDLGGKILLFDSATEKFSAVSHPSGELVRPLGLLRDGNACIQVRSATGPPGGFRLESFDGRRFQPFLPAQTNLVADRELFFAYSAANGDLWLAGATKLMRFRNGAWEIFPESDLNPGHALCIADVGNGKLWFGAGGTLWEFDGKKWNNIRLGFDRVNAIRKLNDGSIWVAANNGLHRFFHDVWTVQSTAEGLPAEAIYSLAEDKQGQLWAGTTRGLSLFHPEADQDPPHVQIRKASIENTSFSEATFTTSFAGRDKWKYTPADRLFFSYRIDEKDWSPFRPENSASFNDLNSGKHRFEVRSMDRNANIGPPEPFAFEVTFPWYTEIKLVGTVLGASILVVFFAAVAFNRHRQLMRSYAEVEKIVALRTSQLARANEELLHGQKMTALGTLAAGIAHDFNNILSIIKGSAQIIEGNLDDSEKIQTRVQRIKMVVEQGSGIVKAMLGFSRPSEKSISPCDLNSLAEETIRLLGDRFQHDIVVEFERTPDLPPAPASKDFLQQMLMNLIFNAADAMGGHGRLAVKTGQLSQLPTPLVLGPRKASGYVFISIQDFGSGITPDVLPRIFEPFFTTKALSARRGTGLGLSMVYEVAREMGFGIFVETKPGHGSTFTIFLPLAPAADPAQQA